jgi:flagellar basal body-associated protein FliL
MRQGQERQRTRRQRLTVTAVLAASFLITVGGAALSGLPGTMQSEKAEAAPAKKKKKGESEVIVLDPFVVALPGSTSARPVRLRFAVAVDTKQPDEVLEEKLQLRNRFLEVVYQLEVQKLRDRGGFFYLRDALTQHAEEMLGEKCGELLLTEYILL